MFWVFRVKNHDFTPKKSDFFQMQREARKFWGISCEKSRFYVKKSYFFQFRGGPPPENIMNKVVIIDQSRLYLKTVNINISNNYIIQELHMSIINISNKPCQCQHTDYGADDIRAYKQSTSRGNDTPIVVKTQKSNLMRTTRFRNNREY